MLLSTIGKRRKHLHSKEQRWLNLIGLTCLSLGLIQGSLNVHCNTMYPPLVLPAITLDKLAQRLQQTRHAREGYLTKDSQFKLQMKRGPEVHSPVGQPVSPWPTKERTNPPEVYLHLMQRATQERQIISSLLQTKLGYPDINIVRRAGARIRCA